jgi:glycosyltransferase involved in cell wall biosynthesis
MDVRSTKAMKRVCIIDPVFTLYRLPVFQELATYCDLDVLASPVCRDSGYGALPTSQSRNFRLFLVPQYTPFGERAGMMQWGIGKYILQHKPDVIITSANPRYLSFWTTALLARLRGISFYAHGHGIYKKKEITKLYRWLTELTLRVVTGYIAYAPIAGSSFARHGFKDEKVRVAHNSMENLCPVSPIEKNGRETGILFIGRLRVGNDLSLLLKVLTRLRRDGICYRLHIVGDGEQSAALKQESAGIDDVIWHGEVYDQQVIREISRDCLVGCYPGNAGLSVVHMMSLSLPVIIHDEAIAHGPEASYIREGESGFLYSRRTPDSLYELLKRLAKHPTVINRLRVTTFQVYESLVNPSLAQRLWSIISNRASGAAEVAPSKIVVF